MAWLLLLLLASGRPLFYWGALPPVVVADGLRGESRAANAVEVHAANDRGDLVLRFGFERPVRLLLALADGTPVSGRLAAVLYIDADDDARTGLELDRADLRTGADQRLELGVLFVGEDPSEGREASAVISATLASLRASGTRRTHWRADDSAHPDRVSAYGEWVDVRIPLDQLDLGAQPRLILTVGHRSWDGRISR
jgi:hypothetical protein